MSVYETAECKKSSVQLLQTSALTLQTREKPRALFICQNWPARPWPDQWVWKWNMLFPRVFAEKLVPSCILLFYDLTDLGEKFWLKMKLVWREWSGWSVGQMESTLSLLFHVWNVCYWVYFKLMSMYYHTQEQRKMKFRPRIKLKHHVNIWNGNFKILLSLSLLLIFPKILQ